MEQTCINPDGRRALTKCVRCGQPFCDDCLRFLVNTDPYCERCGNALQDDLRPRWLPAAFVMLAASATFLVVLVGYTYLVGRFFWALLLLGALGLGAAARFAWNVADPNVADKPRITERRAGDPLPRRRG